MLNDPFALEPLPELDKRPRLPWPRVPEWPRWEPLPLDVPAAGSMPLPEPLDWAIAAPAIVIAAKQANADFS